MHSKKAIIIGSGVAGLAVAIRLSVQGYTVTVYEKNAEPGGKLSIYKKDGYSFDTGPSLFTDPDELKDLFDFAGEDIEAYISYRQLASSCKYFFVNGKTFNTWIDKEKLAQESAEKIGEPAQNILQYLQKSAQLYENIGTVFLNNSLQKKSTWKKKAFIKAFTSVRPGLLFSTLNQYHESAFTTGEAIQVFNRFATYNGSNPYMCPSMLSIIPHVELNKGAFYPKGGMISITDALYKLAIKKGVQFVFSAPVQRIICVNNNAKGIVLNNKNIFSHIVISNVDTWFTYKNLLLDNRKAQHIEKKEKSSSAIVFLWGIKKQFPQMHLHNIFFSGDYKAEFKTIFQLKSVYKDPTIYVNITSKMEDAHAPHGKENWFVMINVPADSGQDWTKMAAFLKQQVLKKLRGMLKEDIEPLIETEKIIMPPEIAANTSAKNGALYGISSNTKRNAFLRHPNFSKEINGLYFCGGTVHPGGGIPLCLKSAKIVGEMVKSEN
ncbi:MAG: phytoene desaturase [Chitinophagaceae bacterium]|nr:phytoene desaturase [Chitinophagaceae bacterium]